MRFRRRIDPAQVVAAAGSAWVRPEPSRVASLGPGAYFLDWAGRKPASDAVHARLRELVERVRAQSGERFRPLLRVDRWLVPLVDIRWTDGGIPPSKDAAPKHA